MKSLGFELIYPRNCKPVSGDLSVEELRKRLNANNVIEEERRFLESTLDGEQASLTQEHSKYKGLFLLLTSPEFLTNADVDIQLRVGVCICKLLKVFCPHNPLSGLSEEKSLTKDVLTFLINCIELLSNLKSKENVNYIKLHTMLYICVQIDTFMWCSVLGDETVLFNFIKMTFAIIKNLDVWSWADVSVVRQAILDMVVKVVVHSEKILTHDIVTFVLQFLIEPAKSTQPAQHTFSRDLIIRTADQIEYQIQMLLQNSLIVGSCNGIKAKTRNKSSPPENNLEDNFTKDINESGSGEEDTNPDPLGEHAFLIIYALHTIQSSIVAPVLPTIELKLKSSLARDRKRSFRLLALLFSESNSLLHRRNPNLWDAFLGRFNDIDSEVRMLCIHMLPQLLSKNQELPHDQLLSCFQQRIYDPDEGVRLLALQTMTALTKKSQSEFSDNFFELLKERSRDKTLSVRKEACFALSSLYKDSLESKCLSTAKSSSALNTILHLYYQNSLDDKFIVERLLKSSIVPYTSKNSARVQALIRCYSLMDEASIKAMQEIFKAQYANLNLLRDTVKLLEEHMRGEMSPEANTKIMSMIQILNGLIPKTEKSVEHLKRFFNQTHTDKDLRRLLVRLTKPQYTCEQVVDTLKEILRKIGKTTGAVNTASDNQTNYSRVVKMLLERCAPVLFDKEFGKELMSQLMVDNQSSSAFGTTESISVARSLRLLLAVSVYFKEILPPGEVINYLLSILSDKNYSENGEAVDEIKSISVNSDCDPYTLQEMALNILCCILGRGTSGSFYTPESNDAIKNVAVQQSLINCAHLSKCSKELLPILRRFCCTGITLNALESNQNKNVSKNLTKTNRGYGVKKLSLGPTTEDIAQMGLVWRRERRRSKLSVRVLFCLLDVVHQLMCPPVDLDSEDEKLMKKKSPDSKMKLNLLKSTIEETLNEIVKVCISCPVLSSEYIACLTSLNHIALLFPGTYNDEIKTLITKSLVQQVLPCEPGDSPNGEEDKNHTKLTALPNHAKPGDNLSTWCPDGLISDLTKAKISAIKLMTNWLVGLKNEVKPVAQAIIRLIYRIIIHDGDLTKGGKISYGEMSRMRLVAATSWLKLARCQAYVECIEIGWYLSMTYILCDPCPQIRSHFLTKLNQGLYKLRLPLEYMAIFAHASNVPEPAFKQRAKQLFIANVQRRRAFLNKNPSYFRDAKYLFGLLPDYILPYLIYLLSHDSKWTKIDDVEILNKIKSSLWFVMEPIMSHGENFSFLRKIIEKIKYARDALNPDDAFVNEKLYTVCDICLGLLLSRCTNPTSKEYPVDVKLPKTLFTSTPIDFRNPDFKQLMNMVVESGTQASEDTLLSESMEAIVQNKTKPILQFTPNKHTKEFKDGLIPLELLKMKNAAIPKTKKTKPASKNEESKAKFETKSKKDNNEPSRPEEKGPVADTVTDDDNEPHKEVNTIHCIASTSRVSPKSTIVDVTNTDINVCIVETRSTRSSSNQNKRKNTSPPGIVKRQRVNPSSNLTSHLHQSTLDRVVQTNKTSQKNISLTPDSVNQQVSSISPRKSPKHLTKPAPEAHSKKSSKPPQSSTNSCSNNSKNTKQESNLCPTPASNDWGTLLRSKSNKNSEKTQGLIDVSKKSLQNANKTLSRTNYRVSTSLRTVDNSNGSNNISERPSRLSAIVAKQKLLSPISVFSSTSTSNQSTPKRR